MPPCSSAVHWACNMWSTLQLYCTHPKCYAKECTCTFKTITNNKVRMYCPLGVMMGVGCYNIAKAQDTVPDSWSMCVKHPANHCSCFFCICWGFASNQFPKVCCADPRVPPVRDPGTVALFLSVFCSSTSIIGMVLAVIDISGLIHVYLIAIEWPHRLTVWRSIASSSSPLVVAIGS